MTNEQAIRTLRDLREHYKTVAAFYAGTGSFKEKRRALQANVAAIEHAITWLGVVAMTSIEAEKRNARHHITSTQERKVSVRHGMFRDHSCWKCREGERPCVVGDPRQCEYPHARND